MSNADVSECVHEIMHAVKLMYRVRQGRVVQERHILNRKEIKGDLLQTLTALIDAILISIFPSAFQMHISAATMHLNDCILNSYV